MSLLGMKTAAKDLICLDTFMMSQSNTINSSFARNPGWEGSAKSMMADHLNLHYV
jgi:hypothetical protein